MTTSARPSIEARTWQHDALQRDLADCRRACGEVVGEKIGLGSWGGHAECDVVTVRPSWTRPQPTVYEIKVARADFLSDVRSEKWRKYLPACERLMFAVPARLVDLREIPPEAGLIVRGPNGWSVRRAARKNSIDSDSYRTLLFALLLKDHPAPWKRPTRDARIRALRETSEHELRTAVRQIAPRIAELARAARDAESLRHRLLRIESTVRPVAPRSWMSVEEMVEWCAERALARDGAA